MLQGSNWGRWLFLGLFLCVWQVASLFVQSDQLPGPWEVIRSLVHHLLDGDLLYSVLVTLRRVLFAFTLAMIAGVVLGFLMGRYSLIDTMFDGVLILGLNIPTGVPLVYELDDDLKPQRHFYLGDPEEIAARARAVAEQAARKG